MTPATALLIVKEVEVYRHHARFALLLYMVVASADLLLLKSVEEIVQSSGMVDVMYSEFMYP